MQMYQIPNCDISISTLRVALYSILRIINSNYFLDDQSQTLKININCTKDIIDIFVNFAFNYYYWTMVSDNRTSNREYNCNCNSRVKLKPNLSQRLLLLNWYYLNLLFEALYTYVHTHIHIYIYHFQRTVQRPVSLVEQFLRARLLAGTGAAARTTVGNWHGTLYRDLIRYT